MKTAEQVLRKYYNPLHGIGGIALIQLELAMKEYARLVARQSLENASGKLDEIPFLHEYCDKEYLVNQIVLDSNIPNLD